MIYNIKRLNNKIKQDKEETKVKIKKKNNKAKILIHNFILFLKKMKNLLK